MLWSTRSHPPVTKPRPKAKAKAKAKSKAKVYTEAKAKAKATAKAKGTLPLLTTYANPTTNCPRVPFPHVPSHSSAASARESVSHNRTRPCPQLIKIELILINRLILDDKVMLCRDAAQDRATGK